MRRASRGKGKKSDVNGDGEEEVRNDKDETGSTNDEETSKSSSRKRDAQGRAKTSEENKSDDEEQENEAKENGKKRKESNPSDEEVDDQDDENDSSINKQKRGKQEVKKSPAKSKKKGKAPAKAQEKKSATKKKEVEEEEDDEVDYEVEKIVDQRTIKGQRQFLVRWKGYSEESDSWEKESFLNCEGLIEEFLAEQEENLENESDKKEKNSKPEKINKSKKQDKKTKETKKALKKKEASTNEGNDETVSDAESTTEYEVEKIIEVHFKKDKTREFQVRWKGFSAKDDTWEPEENLNCPDLIEKFMQKLDKIKNDGVRDLRENRCQTKRYVNTVSDPTNRHSRRTAKKERVNYEEYNE